MPPTCGFGVSERLFGYLMDKPLRECVIFPLMKPEPSLSDKESPRVEKAILVAKPEPKKIELKVKDKKEITKIEDKPKELKIAKKEEKKTEVKTKKEKKK